MGDGGEERAENGEVRFSLYGIKQP
jgi:hypothetical protein